MWAGPTSGVAHPGELIFIPRSYEIPYLTTVKTFAMSQEKDCFDHVVFKQF